MTFSFEDEHVRLGFSERKDGSMVWYNRVPVVDAIRTNRENFYRSIEIDPSRVVAGGCAHAGWRGLVAGILENTVNKMTEAFGSRPVDVQVLIGPRIRVCHFEIKEDLARQLDSEHVESRDGLLYGHLAQESTVAYIGYRL